jgi:hypothetical protein
MKFLLSVVQNLIFFKYFHLKAKQKYFLCFFNILSVENLTAVRTFDYLFDFLSNIQSTKGRFLETNLTGQLVNSPINRKIMHCDWLLSSVSIATLDLTGQLVIGPFQKPGINVL